MRFCGLQLEYEVPDHSVVCRFRKALSHSGAWEVLLNQINNQLTKRGVLVKQGAMAIIDASITPTHQKPKGKSSYTLTEEPGTAPAKTPKPGVDQEAAWVKKGRSATIWPQASLPC
jgi:transposase, IS5 family